MERSIPHIRDIMGYFSPLGSDAVGREVEDLCPKVGKIDVYKVPGNDSAVSIDSSEDERQNNNNNSGNKKEKKKKSKAKREEAERSRGHRNHKEDPGRDHVSRGQKDVDKEFRHLERHLSMKKTIRKKMMRDLRQAFVEDPEEFRDPEKLPPELKNNINLQCLSFAAKSEPSFLDMLRDDDSGNGSPTREQSREQHFHRLDKYTPAPQATPKKGFWSFFKGKKR